ncbi:MAG: glycine--tRNA ligase subunit beta [Pseudomonadota bacterium]
MAELLLELFSEEIPARMQRRAAKDLERLVNQQLLDAGFMPEGVKAFATPRRLTAVATGLPTAQADVREERKGPRVGAPEKAVQGFLRGAGLDRLDACETRSDKKGDYYVAIIEKKGKPTVDIITQMVIDIVANFPWPKSMRWGDGTLKWVRPLRSILCTFDHEIVPVSAHGFTASDTTYGHRMMAPEPIQVRDFESYTGQLKAARVILDTDERMTLIASEARTLCEAQGLALVEDQGLLEEVAGLAEWPVVMIGRYDEKFLTLPDEVLTASMRGHQKYFSVYDPKTGRLANRFIVVANIEASDGGAAMKAGYERVLAARLSDGWYLYHQDLKRPLEERTADLDTVTFFEGLGTIGDKVRRVEALAAKIAPHVSADPAATMRAAKLAKADLVTGMVYEFPELQGVMGRYYALAQDETAGVADAIRDHYKPQGQHDEVPSAPVSVALALADKIDTLTSFWSIDKKPTGSSDPFALRRAALGVIDLILMNDCRYLLPANPGTILTFFHDRLTVYLKDKGFRHDVLSAVRSASDGSLERDLVRLRARAAALATFIDTQNGQNLVAGYKRAANILKAEEKKDNGAAKSGNNTPAEVQTSVFEQPEETALYESLKKAEVTSREAIKNEAYTDAMDALAELRAPVDAFFETVTVNADDAEIRANRLSLLARLRDAVRMIADFEELEG